MIGKLFGKKSNDGFYLQIDETEAAAESTPAAAPVEVKPEPVAVAAPVATATETVAAEPKPKASKSKKKTATTASKVATTPVAPPEEVPIWVRAINNSASKNTQTEDASFAATNLLPLPASRRRPGPSMNGFLDMARQARR
jgi:outer membrane biosynthesis protein TonB